MKINVQQNKEIAIVNIRQQNQESYQEPVESYLNEWFCEAGLISCHFCINGVYFHDSCRSYNLPLMASLLNFLPWHCTQNIIVHGRLPVQVRFPGQYKVDFLWPRALPECNYWLLLLLVQLLCSGSKQEQWQQFSIFVGCFSRLCSFPWDIWALQYAGLGRVKQSPNVLWRGQQDLRAAVMNVQGGERA